MVGIGISEKEVNVRDKLSRWEVYSGVYVAMSKFNWRNGFAIGLTVGIFGTIFLALALDTYPHEETQPYANGAKPENVSPENNRWWLIGRVVYMDDTAAQWLMTILTLAAVALIFLTLKDTRQMVLDTRVIGQAQVRAHLHLEIVDASIKAIDVNGIDHVEVVFTCKVHNTGNSPAHRLSVLYGISQSYVGEVMTANSDGSDLPAAIRGIAAIPSQGEVSVELKRTFPAELQSFSERGSHVGLRYVIKCFDVFNIEVYEPLVSGVFKEYPVGSGEYVFAQSLIVKSELREHKG